MRGVAGRLVLESDITSVPAFLFISVKQLYFFPNFDYTESS